MCTEAITYYIGTHPVCKYSRDTHPAMQLLDAKVYSVKIVRIQDAL